MADVDPHAAPKAGLTPDPPGAMPTRYGCCLFLAAGGVLGLLLGGV